MLKIDRQTQKFTRLDTPSLSDVDITERYDLQEYIFNSPEAFFSEIGQTLSVVGKEVQPSETVQDRIDILALDQEGNSVIIELKRKRHKYHLLQAIAYAGMIADWTPDEFLRLLDTEQREKLLDFLEVEREDINRQQRIILVAEAYDYEVLVGAEWLHDHFGVDITCCRIGLAADPGSNQEYVVCSHVFPAPELAHEAVPRRRREPGETTERWRNWDEALEGIQNQALVDYFKRELDAGRESYLLKRILRYRIDGKRRYFLAARRVAGYVWQQSRFSGDVETWQAGLSDPDTVQPVKRGECLRFFVKTKEDFEFFHQTVTTKLGELEWLSHSPDDEAEDDEEDVEGSEG